MKINFWEIARERKSVQLRPFVLIVNQDFTLPEIQDKPVFLQIVVFFDTGLQIE